MLTVCIPAVFSLVFYQTYTKIFQYFTHKNPIRSERSALFFFDCSNAITKKPDTINIPLDLVQMIKIN